LDQRHLRSIIRLLVEHIGPLHSVYLGQKDTTVGMSFGTSSKVGLYLQRNRIDVSPDEVNALGGHVVLARLYPGFVQAPGQRSRYARFQLSSRGWVRNEPQDAANSMPLHRSRPAIPDRNR
jgi:hypothetical protein